MTYLKRFIIIIPLVCGIALFAVVKARRQPPARVEHLERVKSVRVMPLKQGTVIPRTLGYGYVRADRTWQAIAQVSGQVVRMDDRIKQGYFIKQGELLLQLDTESYGLAESQGVAQVADVDARLRELEQSRKNTEHLLAIEEKALALAVQEYARKKQLFDKQVISVSDLEREETSLLARKTAVNNFKNTLKLIPDQKRRLLAQKKSGESSVAQRRLDVARTEIRAPFDGRISAVNVERHQFAAAGSVLLTAQSIDRAEIPVPLTPRQFFILLPRNRDTAFAGVPDIDTIREAIGITARVRLPLDDQRTIEWEGRFSRPGEALDPLTGTLTFFVTVDAPYAGVIPGKRPPLATNLYVEVLLSGRPLEHRFALPRSAVHDRHIYLCSKDNRLDIRKITPEFFMGDIMVLDQGVAGGETLVLSDLVPAVQGMKLAPIEDVETRDRVAADASGKGY